MKTILEGEGTPMLRLWTKQTCELIDYVTQDDLFTKITERTMQILATMREDGMTISPAQKAGIVFQIRRSTTINNFIRKTIPQYALDVVAISIPETKEIVKLNEMELEAPEIKTALAQVVLIPSYVQNVIEEKTNKPRATNYEKTWPEFWEELKAGTSRMERSLYCKAVSIIENPTSNKKEEAVLKSIFGTEKRNLKSVANWYASKKEIKINSYQEAKKWELRPPTENDGSEDNGTTYAKKAFIMPGKASYELKWSATELFSKRKFNSDARKEDKVKTTIRSTGAKTIRYLEKQDIFALNDMDKFDDIDRMPQEKFEITPRRLTFQEKRGMKHLMIKKWTNFALWNPKYTITQIMDSQFLKFWARSYKALVDRMAMEVEKREEIWYNSLEQITLGLTIERPGKEVGSSCQQQTWRGLLKYPDDDMYIREMQKGLNLFLQKSRQDNVVHIKKQIEEGASQKSVLEADLALARNMDIREILQGLDGLKRFSKLSQIYDMIYIYTDRKELNKITVGKPWGDLARGRQIINLNGIQRIKQLNWECQYENQKCMGTAMSWVCKDEAILTTICESTCNEMELEQHEIKEKNSSARVIFDQGGPQMMETETELETNSGSNWTTDSNPAKRPREEKVK